MSKTPRNAIRVRIVRAKQAQAKLEIKAHRSGEALPYKAVVLQRRIDKLYRSLSEIKP
jgi:hypothetical protein